MSARRAGAVAVALAVTSAAAGVDAQVLTELGGPSGYGDPCPGLAPCDDCSSSPIALAEIFPAGLCFGSGATPDAGAPDGGRPRYATLYVNNNGNATLGQPLRAYEPRPLPVSPVPMLAPFWADVDTRADGRPARNAIYCFHEPGRLVVTWSHVGYFPTSRDLDNTFQLVLRADPSCGAGDFEIEFRYGPLAWTSGATSGGDGGLGGAAASAGIDWGNGRDFLEVPGSRTAALLQRFREEGNTAGTNGLWRWRVRGCETSAGCADAGARCDTGLPGRCAVGSVRCNDGSPRACVPALSPERESCDGLDDDCNGRVDDGADLCGAGGACVRGRCAARCLPELGCLAGTVCGADGYCVEAACATVHCAGDQRCVGGRCVDGCASVTCPTDLVCRAARCVDPCEGVACAAGERCEPSAAGDAGASAGLCVPTCPCAPCGSAERCLDGRCVAVSCVGVVCAAGEACAAGRCVSRCEGARCPAGEACVEGRCEAQVTDAGVVDAPDARVDAPDVIDAGADAAAVFVRRADGCSCATPPPRADASRAGLLAALALCLAARSRRAGVSPRARRSAPAP